MDDPVIESPPLNLDAIVDGKFSANGMQAYRLNLTSGQQVLIRVDKGDIHLQVLICEPATRTCHESGSGPDGKLEMPFTAEVTGPYRIVVRAVGNGYANKTYRLQILASDSQQVSYQQVSLAPQYFAKAEKLRVRWDESSLRAAIENYTEAGKLWQATGELADAAEALSSAGDVHYTLSEYHKALEDYKKTLTLAESIGDERRTIVAQNKVGYAYLYMGDNNEARRHIITALEKLRSLGTTWRDSDIKRIEAQVLNNLGEIYYSSGDLHKSLELFDQARSIFKTAGDRRGEALAHLNMGYSFTDLGKIQESKEHYQESLALWRSVDDRLGTALTQVALCYINSFLGEKQSVLVLGAEAVSRFRVIGNRQGEAVALNTIAKTYEDLGEYQKSLDNYTQALQINNQVGNREYVALDKYSIARIYSLLGDMEHALKLYQQSYELSHALNQHRIEAYTLKEMASIYSSRGQITQALDQLRLAADLYKRVDDQRKLAFTLSDIGNIYHSLGEWQKAGEYFRLALSMILAAKDRLGEAQILYDNARMERDDGNFAGALSLVQNSIEIIESPSTQMKDNKSGFSNTAQVDRYYALYIDLLMHLHMQHPDRQFDIAALLAKERERAHSLMLLLDEEGVALRLNGDQGLAERERELRQLIDAKADYLVRLKSGDTTEVQAHIGVRDIPSKKLNEWQVTDTEQDLHALTVEYDELRAKIREQDPRYAALTQPNTIHVEDIQKEIQDDGTVLLEYALGEDRSYLWFVDASGIQSYELPGRATIEDSARKVYGLLTSRQIHFGETSAQRAEIIRVADSDYWQQASDLSRMLLGPVAGNLSNKRLLIVSDGLLQYIPFEALPDPETLVLGGLSQEKSAGSAASPPPLFLNHEVVGLPSAGTLVAIRQEKAQSASKLIAMLADPVYDRSDPRISVALSDTDPSMAVPGDIAQSRALREVGFHRLPFTLEEVNTIKKQVPKGEALILTGFNANRQWVLSGEMSKYRIVHFATNVILDSDHPADTGIVLSAVNEHGQLQDGFLQLRDIYSLHLPADLVVLSACQTSLGRDTHTAGLSGLTHGFMYAGARSTVGALWKVDDKATAELMGRFYRAMLQGGATPAVALRAAKVEMWQQERWRSPYYWAAFVLQGEYRGHFEAVRGGHGSTITYWIVAAVALLVAAGLCVLWHLRQGRVLNLRRDR